VQIFGDASLLSKPGSWATWTLEMIVDTMTEEDRLQILDAVIPNDFAEAVRDALAVEPIPINVNHDLALKGLMPQWL